MLYLKVRERAAGDAWENLPFPPHFLRNKNVVAFVVEEDITVAEKMQ